MVQKKKKGLWIFFLPFVMPFILVLWNILADQITAYIGSTVWNIGLVVLFVLVFAVPLLPFFRIFSLFGGGYNYFWGAGKKAKEVLLNGRSAKATVISIGENSGGGTMTINNQPVLNLKLLIDDGYRKPYQTSFDLIVSRSAVPQFQPGAMFAVKVDLADPKKVVFDPEATSSVTTSVDSRSNIGGDDWTQLDRTLLKQDGVNAMAKLLGVDDTGRSEDFKPVVKLTYEVYLPGKEPYTFSKNIPISTAIVQKLKTAVGKTFPARIHPKDRTKMHVDITF